MLYPNVAFTHYYNVYLIGHQYIKFTVGPLPVNLFLLCWYCFVKIIEYFKTTALYKFYMLNLRHVFPLTPDRQAFIKSSCLSSLFELFSYLCLVFIAKSPWIFKFIALSGIISCSFNAWYLFQIFQNLLQKVLFNYLFSFSNICNCEGLGRNQYRTSKGTLTWLSQDGSI